MKSRTWRATNLRTGCRDGHVTHKTVLACVLDRRDRDEEVGWRVLTTRRLLADLVGGEAART
jgi:hypothetical protein